MVRPVIAQPARTALRAEEDRDFRMGDYIDVDGKSNIYAIEPKMVMETEEDRKEAVGTGIVLGIVTLVIIVASLTILVTFESNQPGVYKGETLTQIVARLEAQP
eukprot:EG_transcript_39172